MVRLIFLGLVVFFLFTFSYLNQDVKVSLSYLGGVQWGPISASFVVVGSFLVGIILAVVMTFPGWVKLRLQRRKLERRIAQLEEDLDRIRSEALKGTSPAPPRLPAAAEDSLD